jgi:hypothetical protein
VISIQKRSAHASVRIKDFVAKGPASEWR